MSDYNHDIETDNYPTQDEMYASALKRIAELERSYDVLAEEKLDKLVSYKKRVAELEAANDKLDGLNAALDLENKEQAKRIIDLEYEKNETRMTLERIISGQRDTIIGGQKVFDELKAENQRLKDETAKEIWNYIAERDLARKAHEICIKQLISLGKKYETDR